MRKLPSPIFHVLGVMIATFGTSPVFAQSTSPRPAVSLTQFPAIFHAVIPADVTGDGKPDLVGGSSGVMDLVVARGNGDGTFAAPRSLSRPTFPIAVADFNGDTFADIVTAEVAILPGRGDGTFGAAVSVDTGILLNRDIVLPRALARDFNGDGKRDLVLIDRFVIEMYPGNGNLTFGSPIQLPAAGDGALAITSADFNRDGRLDIAASTIGNTVEIFLNTGGFLFRVSPVPVSFSQNEIATADLNLDGKFDVVVATSFWGMEFSPGIFYVLLGNGDGTFQPAVAHGTGINGAVTVAIADFNADGKPDVSTGNRSWRYSDTPCTGLVYWDSVTVTPGTGSGAFGSPATFRLGTVNTDDTYRHTHHALWTSDLNGDGRADLVTAPGAVLLTRSATANRPPQVSAGPDQTQVPGGDILFDGLASDPDHDWLEFLWRDATGQAVRNEPHFCAQEGPGNYTVTVTDGRGGEASDTFRIYPANPDVTFLQLSEISNTVGTQSPYTVRWSATNLTGATTLRLLSSSDDGKTFAPIAGCTGLPITATECAWTAPGPVTSTARVQVEALNSTGARLYFDASERFAIVNALSVSLPVGWIAGDIGAVSAKGTSTSNGTTFTVRGSGSDIWGTADEFHYAFTHVPRDFSITARVTSVQNVNQWTKAGVMIREGVTAGARHAAMFVTPSLAKGTAFQRRPTAGGNSVSTAGPVETAPSWVRLTREGNRIRAFTRTNSAVTWTLVGEQVYSGLAETLQVGLAVSSHVDGVVATATFDNVEIRPDAIEQPEWSEGDVGGVGAEGQAQLAGGAATVTGSGADIWGTADEFHWVHRRAHGDFSFQTLVTSVQNVNVWTKAGLMIRASTAAGAQHASVFATPSSAKGVAFQSRRVTNGTSMQVFSVPVGPQVWLRLTRRGSVINAYYRKPQSQPWQHLGSVVLEGLPATVEVGLAVTSHADGSLATAEFQQMTLEPMRTWSTAQIGPGTSDSYVDGTFFSVNNTGADVWGTSDAFTYVYTKWNGDGALTARLNQLDDVHAWTKGGLMFRETLDPGSRHAFALMSAERGLAFQYRSTTNGTSANAGTRAGSAPAWLQIIRQGNTFTMFVSPDTTVWFPVGEVTMTLPTELYVGLAVTSHNTGADAWGLFDDVTLRLEPFNPATVPTGP